jgi:hypothetical protein
MSSSIASSGSAGRLQFLIMTNLLGLGLLAIVFSCRVRAAPAATCASAWAARKALSWLASCCARVVATVA